MAKTVRTPSLAVYLNGDLGKDQERAKDVQSILEHTTLEKVPDDDKNKRFSSFFRKSPIRTKGKSGKAGGSGGATSPRSSSRLRDNPIGQRVATVGDKAGVLTTAQEGSKKSTLTVKNTIDVDAARAVELTLRPKMIASSEGADRGGSAGKEMKKRGSKTTHVRERSLKLMKKMEQELEKTSVSVYWDVWGVILCTYPCHRHKVAELAVCPHG